MKPLLYSALLFLCASCAASKDDIARIPMIAQAPVERATGTKCGLYTQASTQSEMLATIDSGVRVTILDSSNAFFVRARLSQAGKTMTGYMYKACFSGR